MGIRKLVYVAASGAFLLVVLLIAYDQLVVDYGDDDSYLLGKATPAVAWVLTFATPFALLDFFAWLRRVYKGTSAFWWTTGAVLTGFVIGWFTARGWSLEWLVEGDIEVSFDRDEFLEIVVGLWSASLVALIAWTMLRSSKVGEHSRTHSAATP